MNLGSLLRGLLISLILITNIATANSPYGKMDVYFNGKILPGEEIAKPILKIGEPFDIGINMTVYQKCYVSVMLTEVGDDDFEIVNGSTSKMKDYGTKIMEKNTSKMFNWTVKPTNKWADGSLPINLVYQIDDFETVHTLVDGKFTVAYCSISKEQYNKEAPTSQERPSSKMEPSTTSVSMPAFTLVSAVSILLSFLALFRR